MSWHEHCEHGASILQRFAEPPPLTQVALWDLQLWPSSRPDLSLSIFLPQLPDDPQVRSGQTAEKTDLGFAFHELTGLTIRGAPTSEAASLTIRSEEDGSIAFELAGDSYSVAGLAARASLTYIDILANPSNPSLKEVELSSGFPLAFFGEGAHRERDLPWIGRRTRFLL